MTILTFVYGISIKCEDQSPKRMKPSNRIRKDKLIPENGIFSKKNFTLNFFNATLIKSSMKIIAKK
jgi:hypothetical protein